LSAAKQNTQAFFFDRRVKAADDGDAVISEAARGIESAQERIARRPSGAEKGGLVISEQVQVPDER
jgi:hypothetical protein